MRDIVSSGSILLTEMPICSRVIPDVAWIHRFGGYKDGSYNVHSWTYRQFRTKTILTKPPASLKQLKAAGYVDEVGATFLLEKLLMLKQHHTPRLAKAYYDDDDHEPVGDATKAAYKLAGFSLYELDAYRTCE